MSYNCVCYKDATRVSCALVPSGLSGRRRVRWSCLSLCLDCVWTLTGRCTSLRPGQVTSAHTPAEWHQWAATTPAAPTYVWGQRWNRFPIILSILSMLLLISSHHDFFAFSLSPSHSVFQYLSPSPLLILSTRVSFSAFLIQCSSYCLLMFFVLYISLFIIVSCFPPIRPVSFSPD